jgi:hypothetical protein
LTLKKNLPGEMESFVKARELLEEVTERLRHQVHDLGEVHK